MDKYEIGGYYTKDFSSRTAETILVRKEKSATEDKDFETKMVNKSTSSSGSGKSYRFVGTKEVIDRDGDVVVLDGIDYSYFDKNPVVLWAHKGGETPIGKVVKVEHDMKNKEALFDIEFARTEKGQEIEALVEDGILRATSIGFAVKDWDYDEEYEGRGAFMLKAIELREISICTVPANQEAVAPQKSAGVESTKSVEQVDISAMVEEAVNRAVAEALAKNEHEAPETEQEPADEPETAPESSNEEEADETEVTEAETESNENTNPENEEAPALDLDGLVEALAERLQPVLVDAVRNSVDSTEQPTDPVVEPDNTHNTEDEVVDNENSEDVEETSDAFTVVA